MVNETNRIISSKPQRNRRMINQRYSSEENNSISNSTDNNNSDNNNSDNNNSDNNNSDNNNSDNNLTVKRNNEGSSKSSKGNKHNEEEIILNEKEKLYIENIFHKKKYNFTYLCHTADVILKGWGNNWKECFESIGIAMFNYMCNLENVENIKKKKIVVNGDKIDDLLYNFLTEFHFLYCSEYFICKHIEIVKFDEVHFHINAVGYGDIFDTSIHEGGTEIKAITKHGLRAINQNEEYEVYVLVDI